MTTTQIDPARVKETSAKVIGYLTGAVATAMMHLGDQLGFYRALHGAGPITSAELAAKAGVDERWTREWLHSQVSAGLIQYAGDGRFQLTDEQAAVLADEANGAFLIGGADVVMALIRQKERVQQSIVTGLGVPYDALGVEHAAAEIRFSEPWMRANFIPTILPELGLVPKLTAGAKVAEIDCRSGGTSLEMAKAFPKSEFHGYETSGLCHEKSKERLVSLGLRNITFHKAGFDALGTDPVFDFILTWDCVHDMPDPAAAMRTIRAALKPDGVWLLIDIKGMPTPEENYQHPMGAGPILYSISVLDCLALSTCDHHGAGLGTLGLPEPVAKKMAREAGFTRFTVREFNSKPLSGFYEIRP